MEEVLEDGIRWGTGAVNLNIASEKRLEPLKP